MTHVGGSRTSSPRPKLGEVSDVAGSRESERDKPEQAMSDKTSGKPHTLQTRLQPPARNASRSDAGVAERNAPSTSVVVAFHFSPITNHQSPFTSSLLPLRSDAKGPAVAASSNGTRPGPKPDRGNRSARPCDPENTFSGWLPPFCRWVR
jgi:hypothetical protein